MADPAEPYTAVKVVMMPQDANPLPGLTTLADGTRYPLYSTVFGGVILSHIDMAGAIGARRAVQLKGGNARAAFVTVALNRVEFKKPVLVGDVVSFNVAVVRLGRTSVTVHVDVLAERGAEVISVTEAEAVFVGVDLSTPERRPVPLFPGESPSG
jgi:acyl-CoA thioesterase YciA